MEKLRTYPVSSFTGELRHIHKLRFWPLEEVLHDKYLLSRDESKMIASFLNNMLQLHPEQRASALTMLKHPLISTLTVQGEIDQIVQGEEEAMKLATASDVVSPTEGPAENAGTSAAAEADAGEADASGAGDSNQAAAGAAAGASASASASAGTSTGAGAGAGTGTGASTAAKKKNKKKQKQRNAALANADVEAIEQAEATIAQRAVDDVNALKPIEDDVEGEGELPPTDSSLVGTTAASRSEVDVAGRERTTSAQRPGSS
jgi:type IV secretory pathway TrbL component